MHILFIGNSHTFYHAMPYQCAALLGAMGISARVSMLAEGGKSLVWHAESPATVQALSFVRWDHVIMQQVTHPFPGSQPLCDGVKQLMQLMPDEPSIWLYKTWCEKAIPENQRGIDEAFAAVSNELGLPVIGVSDAWHEFERMAPECDLYDPDARHAGPCGSYLTALCMARALSGQSVLGLPARLQSGQRVLNDIPPPIARLCQSVADQVIPENF